MEQRTSQVLEPAAHHRAGDGSWARASALWARATALWARVPPHWRQAVVLFLVSRAVLTLLGVLALHAFADSPGSPSPGDMFMQHERQAVSGHKWYSMWFAWDSFLYRDIAERPIEGRWTDFGFPLLYPMLAKVVAVPFGGDAALALLVIGNVAYIVLLSYAYRWALLVLGDERSARRCTRYVVLMPTAFLFHAALTESLFVCLAVAVFYHAERGRWLLAGFLGFFLALTRSIGFLAVIPLAMLLLRGNGYRLDARTAAGYLRAGWPLLLLPAGWASFMALSRWQVGDWFAYQHAQQRGWGITMQNPLETIWTGLTASRPLDQARVIGALLVLAVAAAGLRRLHPAYAVYTLVFVLAAMAIGPPVFKSLLRYVLVAFPVAAVLAGRSASRGADAATTAVLAVVQAALFVLWLAYWTHTII